MEKVQHYLVYFIFIKEFCTHLCTPETLNYFVWVHSKQFESPPSLVPEINTTDNQHKEALCTFLFKLVHHMHVVNLQQGHCFGTV